MTRNSILLAALVLFTGILTASAAPKSISGYAKCGNLASIRQGTSDSGTAFGDWYENITSVSVSGSGVSVRIGQKRNGLQNSMAGNGMVGSIDLTFTATANAAPGNRTVTLRWSDGKTETFTVKVIGVARIQSIDVPSLALGFTTVRLTIRGENLANPTRADLRYDGNAFEPVVTAGGADRPGVSNRIVSSTSTTVVVELLFAAPMEQAPMQISLIGSDFCSGYLGSVSQRVIMKAAQPSNPFITRITMPTQPNGVQIGSVATFEITLNKPAPRGLQLAAGGAAANSGGGASTIPQIRPNIDPSQLRDLARLTQGGTVIHWRLASPEIASAVPGDVSYNSGAVLNQMTVPGGEQIKRFNLKIERMPTGASNRNASVVLQTWIGNTNKFTAPEYFEFRFTVIDPNR